MESRWEAHGRCSSAVNEGFGILTSIYEETILWCVTQNIGKSGDSNGRL